MSTNSPVDKTTDKFDVLVSSSYSWEHQKAIGSSTVASSQTNIKIDQVQMYSCFLNLINIRAEYVRCID